jgi:hypothetical protein
METGMFFRDVERPSREGLLTWKREEVREEWGRRQRPTVQNHGKDHLTADVVLMSAGELLQWQFQPKNNRN